MWGIFRCVHFAGAPLSKEQNHKSAKVKNNISQVSRPFIVSTKELRKKCQSFIHVSWIDLGKSILWRASWCGRHHLDLRRGHKCGPEAVRQRRDFRGHGASRPALNLGLLWGQPPPPAACVKTQKEADGLPASSRPWPTCRVWPKWRSLLGPIQVFL